MRKTEVFNSLTNSYFKKKKGKEKEIRGDDTKIGRGRTKQV